jgi:hypothetical protein
MTQTISNMKTGHIYILSEFSDQTRKIGRKKLHHSICIPRQRANYKCTALRQYGCKENRNWEGSVYSIIAKCLDGVDIVSITGFAACVGLGD